MMRKQKQNTTEHYRDMAHHLVKQWQKLNQPKGAL